MDKVKIIMFCMLDCIDGSFMSIVSGRRPQKSWPHQEGAWIQGTYFSLTKNRVQSSQMIEIEHLLSI